MKKSIVLFSILLLLGGLVFGGGCSSKSVAEKVMEVRAEQPQLKATVLDHPPIYDRLNDSLAFNYYSNGLILDAAGNLPRAAGSYKTALKYFPESYEIRYSLANAYFRLRQYDQTLATLDSISPVDESVLILRAASYSELGKANMAKSAYLQLIELEPNNSMAYPHLAGFYRQEGKIDSLIWAYGNMARLRPGNERIWRELGRLQAQNGDYQKARDSFRHSIEVRGDQTNVLSYLGLAELYVIDQNTDSAKIMYKQTLELDPFNMVANRELAAIMVRADSLGAAIPYARKVVEATPLDRDAVRRLGVLYFSVDSLQVADSIFNYLITSGERNSVNHYYLGRIRILNEDYEGAVEQFTVLTQLADSLFESWLDLGYAYGRMGEPEKEILTYQTGLNYVRDQQGELKLLFAMGAAYEQSDQVTEAVGVFEEIIAKSPDHAQALNYLGYMLADRGQQLEYARELIEKAVRIAPDNAAYLDSYGWVFYRLEEYDKALEFLKKAVTLGNDPVIFDHLGDAYRAVGDLDSARVWWRKALELEPDNEPIKEKLGAEQ